MSRGPTLVGTGLPAPGPAVRGAIFTIFGIWLAFAVSLNWGGASSALFELLCGRSDALLRGEIWRLFTAGLVHSPAELSHILFACLGLYFFTPSLEARWGAARTIRFLFGSLWISYAFQFLAGLILPSSISARLVPDLWFGSFPALQAVAIAWALNFEGQIVRLMFVFPVSSRGLLYFVVGFSVLRLIVPDMSPEGLLAPFGGMFAGWLLGSSTPSPLRRAYLKLRLAQLDRESARGRRARSGRVEQSGFRVIDGGRGDGGKSDGGKSDGGKSDGNKSRPGRGPDGKWLN